MTTEQAMKILKNHTEIDEETGEVYCAGMIIVGSLGGNRFRCWEKGPDEQDLEELPPYAKEDEIHEYFVDDGGQVLCVPG